MDDMQATQGFEPGGEGAPGRGTRPPSERRLGRRRFVMGTAAAAGGIAVAGYVKPSMQSLGVPTALAVSGPGLLFKDGTPGMWSGSGGYRGSPYVRMWNSVNDVDWTGIYTPNPFTYDTKFNDFFEPSPDLTNQTFDTMLEIVDDGGGSLWAKKTGRDVVAAYLNASYFGSGYPFTRVEIKAWWHDAIVPYNTNGSTTLLQSLHKKLDAANNGTWMP